jgi:hypothetical protein
MNGTESYAMSIPNRSSSGHLSNGDPFPSAAVTRRALDDLRAIAAVMHERRRHPDDMLHALAEQAALWHRQGAKLDSDDVLRIVRQLHPDYQPYADLQHAMMQDRIAAAIAQMQQQIAGAAYRDGIGDAMGLSHEKTIELIRDILAEDLPDALRYLGVVFRRRT